MSHANHLLIYSKERRCVVNLKRQYVNRKDWLHHKRLYCFNCKVEIQDWWTRFQVRVLIFSKPFN